MTKLDKTLLRSASVFGLGLALSACGSSSSVPPIASPAPTPAPSTAVRQEDQFGTQFGIAFRADPNSEPFAVNDGDLVAISFTTEPVTIN